MPVHMPDFDSLLKWALATQTFPMVNPATAPVDYHRLQIEWWLWVHGQRVLEDTRPKVDIGAEYPHRFFSNLLQANDHRYETEYSPGQPDLLADAQQLPFADGSLSTVLCMETLEHVPDPVGALREIHRVLCPGGILLASTPFFWPDHGGPNFQDYWRFTSAGWGQLLRASGLWSDIDITPTKVRPQTILPYTIAAQNEVMIVDEVRIDPERYTSGFLVQATKWRP